MGIFWPAPGPSNAEFASLQDGLAIVADGNTHIAITSGQYVYVKNHDTLSDGLYKASSNIAANATLSSSNLTADSKGGLNDLSDQMAIQDVSSWFQNVTTVNYAIKIGHIVFYNIYIAGISISANASYILYNVIKSGHLPTYGALCSVFPGQDDHPMVQGSLNTAGHLSIRHGSSTIPNCNYTFSGYLIYND